MNLTADYFFREYKFLRLPGQGPDTAVLIHGWGVRASSMARLANVLNRAGYTVLNYDYPSSAQHIVTHAARFSALFRQEKISGKLHFLTHSMGGLILRRAMAEMTPEECRRIESVVMLGPPNRGSRLAWFGRIFPFSLCNVSLGDMVPGSPALDIPQPADLPPVGIIAGKRDGKVAFEATTLPDGMPFERTTVDCTHPGLRDPENTASLILKFFREKHF